MFLGQLDELQEEGIARGVVSGLVVRLLGGFVSILLGRREEGRKGGRKYIVMHPYEPFLIELIVVIAGLVCKEIIFPQ